MPRCDRWGWGGGGPQLSFIDKLTAPRGPDCPPLSPLLLHSFVSSLALLSPLRTGGMTLSLSAAICPGMGGPVWDCVCPVWSYRDDGGRCCLDNSNKTQTLLLVVLSGGSSAAAGICLDCIRLNNSSYQLLKREQSRAHLALCTLTCGFVDLLRSGVLSGATVLKLWCDLGSSRGHLGCSSGQMVVRFLEGVSGFHGMISWLHF